MKKLLLFCVLIVVFLSGCSQTDQVATETDDTRKKTGKAEIDAEFNVGDIKSDYLEFIPKEAEIFIDKNISFTEDEKGRVLFYDLNKNRKLLILKKNQDTYELLKLDQITPVDGWNEFLNIKIINLTDSTNQGVLVFKDVSEGIERSGRRYYVFGKNQDKFEDLPISKGYLHKELYVENSESCIFDLTYLHEEEGTIYETYNVDCGAKYWEMPTKTFQIKQTYINGEYKAYKLFDYLIFDESDYYYPFVEGYIYTEYADNSKDNKLLIKENITDIFPDDKFGTYTNIFHTTHYGGKDYIFFYSHDHNGHKWLIHGYIIVNKDKTTEIKSRNKETIYFYNDNISFSPDGIRMVYRERAKNVANYDSTYAYIFKVYNFITGESQTLQKSTNGKVFMCTDYTCKGTVFWVGNDKILIETTDTNGVRNQQLFDADI